MLNPLIHYEVEMARQYQEQLRRKSTLWDLAQRHARSTSRSRLARPGPRHIALTLVAILLGVVAAASQGVHG